MGKFKKSPYKQEKNTVESDGSSFRPKKKKRVSFNLESQNVEKKQFKAKNKIAKKNNVSNAASKMSNFHMKGQDNGNKFMHSKPTGNNFGKGKLRRKFRGNSAFAKPINKGAKKQGAGSQLKQNEEEMEVDPENPKKKLPKKFKSENKADNNEILFMKKKERKLLRKEKEMKKNVGSFERATRLKALWETLRKEDCKEPQKTQLVNECMKLLNGHIKELAFAHDTVRVIECVFGFAQGQQRTSIFEELKDSIVMLAKSKYGKFILIKILRSGNKEQKNYVMSQLYSKVLSLLSHSEASNVIEVAFNECASAVQRAELVQEFYGASYRFFKSSECSSLNQLLEKHPEQKVAIINNMKEALSKVVQKNVIQHSIVHYVVREFMVHADNESRSEIIELLKSLAVEMLHTKDGSRVAMYCLWYGNVKDRKAIVKSFKTHAVKIAKEEHGHMVLLALFDCVDDTVLVQKHVISDLMTNCLDVSENVYGKKVLLYLLSPRNTLYFVPDIIKILQLGDNNPHSKKTASVRAEELRKCVVQPLVSLVTNHIPKHFSSDNSFCWFAYAVLKHSRGHNLEAYKCIARLAAEEYSAANKNRHIIECPGSHLVLKKIFHDDKDYDGDAVGQTFSEILMEEASAAVLQSWTLCNRGCFLLLCILETGIPSVVEKMKEAMNGFHTKLSKKTFVGAQLLLKKLKEF